MSHIGRLNRCVLLGKPDHDQVKRAQRPVGDKIHRCLARRAQAHDNPMRRDPTVTQRSGPLSTGLCGETLIHLCKGRRYAAEVIDDVGEQRLDGR